MSRLFHCVAILTCIFLPSPSVRGQPKDDFNQPEFPARPAPPWVEMADQGAIDPALKGLQAPRGLKVEIVAQEPAVINPVGLAFADDGGLHVLQWQQGTKSRIEAEKLGAPGAPGPEYHRTIKDAPDELKSLHDSDRDGTYDEARVVMNDLELPGGLLFHEGWICYTSGGRVLRRRLHDAELLRELQSAAAAKRGSPAATSADGKWIEQVLLRGLAGVTPFQASGLTIGMDGWLYVTAGSGDNRAESWDGSRAVVLKSGGIFRLRPDGSRVSEFARGLQNPSGGIAFDELGNPFHLDDDLEASGKFAGVRLLHLLEGADYGWRHRDPTANNAFDSQALGQPDLARAAAWGERPGKLPGVFKTGPGTPAGLIVCTSAQFPFFFRGLLIYPDPDRKLVRAYMVEREGETFKVVSQFDLLRGEDPLFRPCHAVQGPDGAIYIADWRSEGSRAGRLWGDGKHGRIYRLSWGGNADQPAIPLLPLDTWKQIAEGSEDQLTALLSHEDVELRRRAAGELVRRARLDESVSPAIAARLTTIAYDESRPAQIRAPALFAASQLWDRTAFEALMLMLNHEDPDIQRLTADALSDHPPRDEEARTRLVQVLQHHLFAPKPGVPRSMFLAHGKLAGKLETSEWAFEAASVTIRKEMGPQIFDAHVRALEMTEGAARDLLLGNLDVAVNFTDADAKERERIKEFAVATAEAMRTRELAVFLDALFRGEEDLAAKLEPPFQARLIRAYRNVQVEPPVNADAVAEWLDRHPGLPPEVEIAALETLSLVGTTKAEAATKLAERLLTQPASAKEVARRFAAGHIGGSLKQPIAAALRKHGEQDQTGDFAKLLKEISTGSPLNPNP